MFSGVLLPLRLQLSHQILPKRIEHSNGMWHSALGHRYFSFSLSFCRAIFSLSFLTLFVPLSARLSFTFLLVLSLHKIGPMSWIVVPVWHGRIQNNIFEHFISQFVCFDVYFELFALHMSCGNFTFAMPLHLFISSCSRAFCMNEPVEWWTLNGAQPSM